MYIFMEWSNRFRGDIILFKFGFRMIDLKLWYIFGDDFRYNGIIIRVIDKEID